MKHDIAAATDHLETVSFDLFCDILVDNSLISPLELQWGRSSSIPMRSYWYTAANLILVRSVMVRVVSRDHLSRLWFFGPRLSWYVGERRVQISILYFADRVSQKLDGNWESNWVLIDKKFTINKTQSNNVLLILLRNSSYNWLEID